MYSPLELLFWVNFAYFLFSITVSFFIPGNLLIRKLKLAPFSEIILSTVVGFVLWCCQGFIFGYASMRFLTYAYIIICVFLWILLYGKEFFHQQHFHKPDVSISILLILGTLVQLVSVWLNGIKVNGGVYFCCGIPDSLYHAALTNVLVTQFPPVEPGVSGVLLQNYHYLSNLAIADLVRIFHLPLLNTAYQYMTILFSFLLGLTTLAIANTLHLNKHIKVWLLFLVYFVGDIIYILPFINGKGFNFTLTTIESASSLWTSPPRVYSIVVFFAGVTLFTLWLKRKDVLTGCIMAVVFGSLVGIKIYVSAIMLSGFGVLALIYLVQKKWKLLIPIILFYCICLALYLPVNSKAGGLFYSGFWRFEDFIVQPSLGLSSLELARRVYLDHHSYIRVLTYDILFGFLYIVFSSGVMLIGLIQTKTTLKKLPKYFTLTLGVGLVSTCIAGFFFLQKVGGANSSQFLISLYLIGVLYAAISIEWIVKNISRKKAYVVGSIFILLASTRVIHNTYININNLSQGVGIFVNNTTLNSYQYFTKAKPGSTVLMYDETNCLFIRMLSDSFPYICPDGAPGDRGVTLSNRIEVKNTIFTGKDIEINRRLLHANKISYIYMPKKQVAGSTIEKMHLPKVFDNTTIAIYQVTN